MRGPPTGMARRMIAVGRSGYIAPPPSGAGGANAHALREPQGEPFGVPTGAADPAPAWGRSTSEDDVDLRTSLPPIPRLDPSRLAPVAGNEEPRLQPRIRPDAPAGRPEPLPTWSIVLADGVSLPIYGPVVIGRNPQATQFPNATVAAVPDPTRTMSKTHARFYVEHDTLMVDDLGSTNGTALFPGGNTSGALTVEPGRPVEARSGDVVQLGEYEVSIRRN
ncbi:FHA domain-containing protein [Pseudoclavibacter chungangensis]|uniref:FHA domain-containing protein n=1 Tax=Pseudoclavibacter chungangensis TaxID=587635 RepID=A0A7J5BZR0_9MICO|nr:FHA domain-containing protein [Pseudoclavibacter chungangensis]